MIVGYARVSTSDQTAGLEAQERDLTAMGAERLYSERVSSVAQHVKLAKCLAYLRDGDVLAVTKPDRLARSTAELLAIEADLSRRGVGLIVLSMGGECLDTRNPTSKLMLTILAGVATWEREMMLERQREGIAKAKAEGKYMGRKPTLDPAAVAVLAQTMGPAAIAKHLARIIHRSARNRPRPPNTWARDFIAKNFIKQPIRIVSNDINDLALIAHSS